MDEDTKTEPEWLTEIRAELNSAPGYMFGDTGDIERGAAVKLLRDRDHWKREAHGQARVVAALDALVDKMRTEISQAKRDMAAQVEELASARANERSAIAALAAQGDALDAARLAEQRWYAESKRLHDQAEADAATLAHYVELVEGLQEAANAGADRSRLEVAQHAASLLAQRETSPRLMRALFELAVAEREERTQLRGPSIINVTGKISDETASRIAAAFDRDAAALAGDPEAGS